MLKKSLIGLGIGLGVLAVCIILTVTAGMMGGMIGYLGGRSVTGEAPPQAPTLPEASPQPPEQWWQRPPSVWGFLSPALVTEVVEDSPAEESGVEVGDIVIGIDGNALDAEHELADVIRENDPGDEIALTILRRNDDTEILELEITLGRNREEDGEIVAYLGLWYRRLGSGMSFTIPEAQTWD
jgi:membrane-associated protease RseP (regulator of RpoE activity)